ncbi:MAG: hypothetical protein R2881_08330 [Eubacteriales bacterium]
MKRCSVGGRVVMEGVMMRTMSGGIALLFERRRQHRNRIHTQRNRART